jgi:hypothetical protein
LFDGRKANCGIVNGVPPWAFQTSQGPLVPSLKQIHGVEIQRQGAKVPRRKGKTMKSEMRLAGHLRSLDGAPGFLAEDLSNHRAFASLR